jgi:hypothetical protein
MGICAAGRMPARAFLFLPLLLPLTTAPAPVAAPAPAAALIQLRGEPLAGGRISGSASVPLERAAGGDTPVLTLASARGPVRLLLDTGASSSMVTPALAGRLGLSSRALPAGAFALAGAGSGCPSLEPRRTVLPPLQLRGQAGDTLRLRGAEALVMPVEALPKGVDGVLGAPSLRLMPIRIDPRGGRVSFAAAALAASTPPAGPARQGLPLRWHHGVPLLNLTTTAGPVPALADTGAEGLFVSPSLAGRLQPLGAARPLRLVGFCGEQPVRGQAFAGLALAGDPPSLTVRPVEAVITENPIFAELGVEAIVGQELLRHRVQLWRLDQQPPRLELP